MSKSAPLLTIAMPIYNGGDLLPLALLSIINQTFQDWELLLIDDGSNDNSLAGIEHLSDHRIKLIQDGRNKGLAARLNEAIELTRSDYFARMDQDDIAHPERFSRQIAYLKTNSNIDLVGTSCLTIDEQNNITGTFPLSTTHKELCESPWKGFYLPHPTWLGKTQWFKKNNYAKPGPYCCEDQELLLRTYKNSQFYVIPTPLLAYRVRNSTPWRKQWKTRCSLRKEQSKYFKSNKEYKYLLFCYIFFVLRVLSDGISTSCKVIYATHSYEKGNKINNPSWEAIIENIISQSIPHKNINPSHKK